MPKSKSSANEVQDPSQVAIQAIEQIDLKALSYIQLRRLYATVMQTVNEVSDELTARAEEDNGGDTVRVPVPSAAK